MSIHVPNWLGFDPPFPFPTPGNTGDAQEIEQVHRVRAQGTLEDFDQHFTTSAAAATAVTDQQTYEDPSVQGSEGYTYH